MSAYLDAITAILKRIEAEQAKSMAAASVAVRYVMPSLPRRE